MIYPPKQAGAVLVGLALHANREMVRVLGAHPFRRITEVNRIEIEPLATVEVVFDDPRILYVLMFRQLDSFGYFARLVKQGIHTQVLSGKWRITVTGRDAKKGHLQRTFDAEFDPGQTRVLNLNLRKDE